MDRVGTVPRASLSSPGLPSRNTRIEALFPGLVRDGYVITSPIDPQYNCIAWAAGDQQRWWEPVPFNSGQNLGGLYWPEGVAPWPTLESYQQAYETLGYESCFEGDVEDGFEKVAIYVDPQNKPLHAARQLPSGAWTSKLGQAYDVEHPEAGSVSGAEYGRVAVFMRRPHEGVA